LLLLEKESKDYTYVRCNVYIVFPIYVTSWINEKYYANSLHSCLHNFSQHVISTLFHLSKEHEITRVRMAPRSSSFEAGSSLPRNLCARLLRRMLDALLWGPLHHPRCGRGFFNREDDVAAATPLPGELLTVAIPAPMRIIAAIRCCHGKDQSWPVLLSLWRRRILLARVHVGDASQLPNSGNTTGTTP